MEKLVYALWRPAGTTSETWSAQLLGPVAEQLLAAGARGLQVNVDDPPVAGAVVRLHTFAQPIEAVVSVWLDTAADGPRADVDHALTSAASRMAGYLVTESVPLRPPDLPDGSRTDGLANVAFLRRPDHLDQPTWLHRWQDLHTPVALATQSTFGYVQNVVVRAVTADAPVVHAIVEELFPAAALRDLHVFFDTGGSDEELTRRLDAMNTSVANFSGADAELDVVPSSRHVLRALRP